jgi:hypothetical protein
MRSTVVMAPPRPSSLEKLGTYPIDHLSYTKADIEIQRGKLLCEKNIIETRVVNVETPKKKG